MYRARAALVVAALIPMVSAAKEWEPVILSASMDATSSQVFVHGHNFGGFTESSRLSLGEHVLQVSSSDWTSTDIRASLPSGLSPGTYRLAVGTRRGEATIAFTLGSAGPQGPQGPAGAQGLPGPQGPQGAFSTTACHEHFGAVVSLGTSLAEARVDCPSGRALSGGYYFYIWSGAGTTPCGVPISSTPIPGGNGWLVQWQVYDTARCSYNTVRAFVVCCE